MRRTYHESCAKLQSAGWLDAGGVPPMPKCRPQFDDPEPLGVNFFRTRVEGDFTATTLPRTLFCRSEIRDASFRDSDLSESSLCWCDFVNVDFSDGCLRASDLRASSFERVRFVKCDLSDADLRRSSFFDCEFTGCVMRGTKLTRKQADQLALSPQQYDQVAWQSDDGDEPAGG